MDKNAVTEIDISAILSTYVYMGDVDPNHFYTDKQLDEILELMPLKDSDEWKAVKAAVKLNPELGKMTLVSQSICDGYSEKLVVACAFQDTSGKTYIVYRGTGDGKWVDNGIAIANESSQMQREANAYYDHVVESLRLDTNRSGRIIVTGHSKGGNEAQYVTLNSKYGYLIDNCYSIDGQGFSQAAIDHIIELYGEDYYLQQLEKMYSINGENDYVHDLGIPVIPEDHTYFVKTPNDKSIGGYHDIIKMINGAGLNWHEDGKIVFVDQGPIGQFAKALSERMQYLDQEDLEDCAVTIMSLLERFMPYNDVIGGEYKQGTGDRSFMTTEECIGFWAHGIPLLAETLLLTEEGRELVMDAVKSGIKGISDKCGVMGVVAAGFITVLLTPSILTFVGGVVEVVVIIANIMDFCTDLVDKIKDVSEKNKQFFSNVKEAVISAVDKIAAWYKCHTVAFKYANANPQIVVDTYKLKTYAQRLQSVNKRLSTLDNRIDSLYWRVGLLDLWNLMRSDFRIGYSSRINSCANFLNNTASDFERVEKEILAQIG